MISTDARCYSIKSLTVLDRIQLIRLLLLLSFSPRRLLLLAAFVLRWHLLLGWRGGWGWDDSKTSSSLALLSSVFWGSARKSDLCFVGCKSRAADDSLSHWLHYLVVAAPHPLPTPPSHPHLKWTKRRKFLMPFHCVLPTCDNNADILTDTVIVNSSFCPSGCFCHSGFLLLLVLFLPFSALIVLMLWLVICSHNYRTSSNSSPSTMSTESFAHVHVLCV